MGKVKNWTVEKKDAIESMLINLWASVGMDIPSNYEVIVQDCYEDVCETADPHAWHSGDVAIAFRRWIEAQTTRQVDAMYDKEHENVQDKSSLTIILNNLMEEGQELIDGGNSHEKAEGRAIQRVVAAIRNDVSKEPTEKPYFEIMKQGWDAEIGREEIQIHGGENANIFLIKTDDGFIVDVYGQNNSDPMTMAVWEENLMDEDDE